MSAQDARAAGFVNSVVPPAKPSSGSKGVREICALRRMGSLSLAAMKLPTEDLVRRMDQEDHFFGERMRSPEAIAAFQNFLLRKKKSL